MSATWKARTPSEAPFRSAIVKLIASSPSAIRVGAGITEMRPRSFMRLVSMALTPTTQRPVAGTSRPHSRQCVAHPDERPAAATRATAAGRLAVRAATTVGSIAAAATATAGADGRIR